MTLRGTVSNVRVQLKKTESSPEPRYQVIFYSTMMIALAVLLFSFLLVGQQELQNRALSESLGTVEDQGASLRGRLADVSSVASTARTDRTAPHPILADRDVHLIGTHADVSWTSGSDPRLANASYEINLLRLPNRTGDGTVQGSSVSTFFPASDSQHLTSRIPSKPGLQLPPGTYLWRVAAVSPGYKVSTNMHLDTGNLTPWSNYGSFTLDENIESRINATGLVRIGVDYSQNSTFTFAEDGELAGTDVYLAKTLIQECLARHDGGVMLDRDHCDSPSDGATPKANCIPTTGRLCVQFVSIARWGDWRPALRRKEIDLFIGGITAAEVREGDGVSFMHPYDAYETRLYVNPEDAGQQATTLPQWSTHTRSIGVIESSSNEEFLNRIIAVRCPSSGSGKPIVACHIEKKTFASFPAMDRAMDAGLVDGVLIDDTFVNGKEWKTLSDLRVSERPAWDAYKKTFLGRDIGKDGRERHAFAVAVDNPGRGKRSLRDALNDALEIVQHRASTVDTASRKNVVSK